ncbi:MAG: hypothetical protein KDC44_23455, partial [Phaeodactylibacter sp.]|nr:hypothetical protein [Phaeodactylibacter sp.]
TDDAFEEGRYIQFFETALEWRLMTYLFYPYFWGNKASWPETLQIRDNDPLFEKFLQAGAARIQVPVRPGFERALCSYIEGGVMVGERDEDACIDNENQSLFLSMLDELKEQLNNDFVDRDGTLSFTKDSRIVLGTGTDFKQEDRDRELLVDLKIYRIAEVLSPTEIRLRKPYEGTSVAEQAFAVGAKLVGEPWVVKVPTNLVHLQKSGELS